ncbi:MAG: hypothetical protein ABL931_23845, partial [Usitatibacteraceae bacterium]
MSARQLRFAGRRYAEKLRRPLGQLRVRRRAHPAQIEPVVQRVDLARQNKSRKYVALGLHVAERRGKKKAQYPRSGSDFLNHQINQWKLVQA